MHTRHLIERLALSERGGWRHVLTVALICTGGAVALRLLLSPLIGGYPGYVVLAPSVVVAALWAGRAAGLITAALCLAASVFASVYLMGAGPDDRVAVIGGGGTFVLVGGLLTLLAAAFRDTLRGQALLVSELKDSQALVQSSEARIAMLSEHAPTMLWLSDAQGGCVHLNAELRAFWGVQGSSSEFDFTSSLHPDDAERVVSATMAAAMAREPLEVEARYRRHDGVWRILNTRARPRFSPGGEFQGMIGVNTDVTDVREAEAALRESEARFRLLADTAPSPVWLTNAEAEVEFVNQALVDFYGKAAEELAGHTWRDRLHPDDLPGMLAIQAEARPQRRPYQFESRFQRGDGQWRWMRVSVKPRFAGDGEFMGYVGMSFDITETRDALDALARQERRQSLLLELSDRLRELTEPVAVMMEISRSLGEALDIERVGYGEIDGAMQTITVREAWVQRGMPPISGTWRMDDFGPALIRQYRAGRSAAVDDVGEDKRTADIAAAFASIDTRTVAAAPVMRGGVMQALIFAHGPEPRRWTAEDLELMEAVASRAWAEVERARAETAVRESEERFRAIADTAPVLIWVTAKDRSREFVNQAYVDYNGGTYEQARTADWRAAIHPDDQERVLKESIAGEATLKPFSLEARYLRRDGEYRWLKSFSRPRLGAGGELLGFVGVAFDVNDIREAQARLQESETRFRTVADSAPALIWMMDAEGRPAFANRRYRTFFGISSEADMIEGWLRLVEPEENARFDAAYKEAWARRDRFDSLIRVRHPTLGERWLRCEGLPRFDAEGGFQGYVGANLDVTEAKRAEQDLKRINELLEERVGEALAEKAKAEADLMHAQRMEAVGRLTGGVAHDFNNLLTVVIGALDIILRSPDDADKRRKLGEAALSAARRGERLTHQLLAFSRRQALRPEAVDLNALITESEPLLRRALGEAVDFRLELMHRPARVNVDPAQFEAALLNLVVNARDAVGDTGTVTVATRLERLKAGEVADLEAGSYVRVSVTDTGEGLAPDVIERVFEPFFTTKPVGKGTGLGLSQVYGFTRQSGGAAAIRSEPGEGAEIRLYLPALKASTTKASAADPVAGPDRVSGRRVLLVEDDEGVAAVASDLLREMGMTVAVAGSGPEAMDRLKTETFDLMLTDVVMPGGMTGVELGRQSARAYPDMRIVLASGYVGDDVESQLKDAPWPFLRKPYSADELRAVLGGEG